MEKTVNLLTEVFRRSIFCAATGLTPMVSVLAATKSPACSRRTYLQTTTYLISSGRYLDGEGLCLKRVDVAEALIGRTTFLFLSAFLCLSYSACRLSISLLGTLIRALASFSKRWYSSEGFSDFPLFIFASFFSVLSISADLFSKEPPHLCEFLR